MIPTIGSRIVPYEWPEGAKVVCIGEAPGREEEEERRPFVGKSGRRLRSFLSRAGVENCGFANISRLRPKGNRFEYLLDAEILLNEELEYLSEEIERRKPNLIVALGNWPMWFLTGMTAMKKKRGTGITQWRGSIVPCKLVSGYKVLITYHPAFIVRPQGARWAPVMYNDIMKIPHEMQFRELVEHKFESYVNPEPDLLEDLISQMSRAEWLSIDIETFGAGHLACVGFSDREDRGLCLTTHDPRTETFAPILLSSRARKILQYGNYDINWLLRFKGWEVKNYAWDTYVAAASLMPEFPRGLDFLTSIYTPLPYYKDERKEWKESEDLNTLWTYNIKDVIATYMIAAEQMKEVNEEWLA